MARTRKLQTNFSGGQVTEEAVGRSDLRVWQNGCGLGVNSQARIEGGLKRRNGTLSLRTSVRGRTQALETISESFRFNDAQEYLFAFTDTQVDIFLPDGTLAQSLSGQPWTTAQLREMRFTQAGDTMIITHPAWPTKRILRTSGSTFTIADLEFEAANTGTNLRQPYFRFQDTDIYLEISSNLASANPITLTAATAPGVPATIFSAEMVGQTWRLGYFIENTFDDIMVLRWYQLTITAYGNSSTVSANLSEDFPDWRLISGTPGSRAEFLREQYELLPWWTGSPGNNSPVPTFVWEEPAFSTTRGYARSCTFHNNRLWFGGSRDLPAAMIGSRAGAFFNFDLRDGAAEDAIFWLIGTGVGQQIEHVVSHKNLMIFTDLGEFFVPESRTRPITPENMATPQFDSYGASNVRPVIFDNSVVYIQNNGLTVREVAYEDLNESYQSTALNLIASGFFTAGVREMTAIYSNEDRPEQYVIFVLDDGNAVIFHGARNEQIASFLPWSTDGSFVSCVGFGQDLFLWCDRNPDGTPTVFLEQWDQRLTLDNVSFATPTDKVVSGLSDYEGEQVAVNEIDATTKLWKQFLGYFTVSGGQVTLPQAVTEVAVGFDFAREIELLPVQIALGDGEVAGKKIRSVRAYMRVFESLAVEVNGNTVGVRRLEDLVEEPTPLKTGIFAVPRMMGWTREGKVKFRQLEPSPFTLLSVNLEVVV